MVRPAGRLVATFVVTAASLLVVALLAHAAEAAAPTYPLVPVVGVTGSPICDPLGDESPTTVDMACNTSGASAYAGSDGTTISFGFVLAADPRTGGVSAPLDGGNYNVQLAVNGVWVATVGVLAKGGNATDTIYAKCAGALTDNYTKSAAQAITDGELSVVADGTLFRMTFTVPLSSLATCGITASTPVQMFFGTGTNNNDPEALNKDLFIGNTVNFNVVPPITFAGSLALAKTATFVSGANPPVVGQVSTYDLAVTATAQSLYTLTNVSITDTLPAGVTIVS
ncbi:MAG: hypothetical protein ABR520_01830, partial [Mycobacteriales bacterium]